jgi:ferredoxin
MNPTDASTTLDTRTTAPRIKVRVSVDNNHCHLFAICQQEAPEVYALAGERLVYDHSPDPDQLEAIRTAARLCPMQAIEVRVIERRRRP